MRLKNASFLKRLKFAINGIIGTWQREASFRIQVLCAFGLLVFCIFMRPSFIWCAIFATNAALVLSLEMANTALETLADKIHPEVNPQIGFAKDCAAGAVLAASLGAILVFLLYLVTHFFGINH